MDGAVEVIGLDELHSLGRQLEDAIASAIQAETYALEDYYNRQHDENLHAVGVYPYRGNRLAGYVELVDTSISFGEMNQAVTRILSYKEGGTPPAPPAAPTTAPPRISPTSTALLQTAPAPTEQGSSPPTVPPPTGPQQPSFPQGYPGFDMKPGLLRSPKAKMGKAGQRYIDVPLKGTGEIRRVSAQWQDRRGIHGSAPRSWWHPGLAAQREDEPDVEHEVTTGFFRRIADFFARFIR